MATITKPPIHIGTSGWNYFHWKGVFYPPDLKSKDWLSFYGEHFDTLELNVTFYRGVKAETFEKWRALVPPGFLFSMKMSRFITHIKRLKVEAESVSRFMKGAALLGDKAGVFLIQLPPSLEYHEETVSSFLTLLNPRFRYTVEARNKSFLNDAFFSLLKERNCAWCISESAGRFPYAEVLTADFVYMRLHGRENLYTSNYSEEELFAIKKKLIQWGKECYVYFDNDAKGFAALNAASLKKMVEG
jgi:uncharacterized protein YecE (DUF72 family)